MSRTEGMIFSILKNWLFYFILFIGIAGVILVTLTMYVFEFFIPD